MISCLCITRGDRLAMLAEAVADFSRQTMPDRELVILHDGPTALDHAINEIAGQHTHCVVRVVQVPPGLKLGGLRNAAVAAAQGDWVCQWDDDDRYHPARLALQHDAAQQQGTDVCYLVDQLHWFQEEGRLCWDDWNFESYPVNVIQGTILARRRVMPDYPDLSRGEDTLHTHAIMRAAAQSGRSVARLRGAGWCYIYRHHGGNVWSAAHHGAISGLKHLPPATLLPRWKALGQRLSEYSPPLPRLYMPVGAKIVLVNEPV